MKNIRKRILPVLLSASFLLVSCRKKPETPVQPAVPDIVETTAPSASPSVSPVPENTPAAPAETPAETPASAVSEDTKCDDKDCVAYYVYTYGHLPSNYMTKKEARQRGWSSGALSQMLEGMAIGGDRFGNTEGYLPAEDIYYECDIDTIGRKKRGVKRIIFTAGGGRVYYTEDHYETFELLYGEE